MQRVLNWKKKAAYYAQFPELIDYLNHLIKEGETITHVVVMKSTSNKMLGQEVSEAIIICTREQIKPWIPK